MSLPYYCPHIGTKSDVYNGITIYLKDVKISIEQRKKDNSKLNKIISDCKNDLELQLNKEKKDIEYITFLKKDIENKTEKYIKESSELTNNSTKFMVDLCELLL
jgi:hypothetical protein